jgi:ring-1,2-phenylacetyl-CoA epoxidase subunit PaaC
VIRLGDGTPESHARAQAALDTLWPYTAELFAAAALEERAAHEGLGVAGAHLGSAWESAVGPLLDEATLRVPGATPFLSRGKQGLHSEHMGHLLAEMQYLQRAYPGAKW